MVWSAAPGERSEVPGHRQQAASKPQLTLGHGVSLYGAHFSVRACAAEPSDALRDQPDPLGPPLGGASPISF